MAKKDANYICLTWGYLFSSARLKHSSNDVGGSDELYMICSKNAVERKSSILFGDTFLFSLWSDAY